jgi:GTP-binding protein EngB required for normal cell division
MAMTAYEKLHQPYSDARPEVELATEIQNAKSILQSHFGSTDPYVARLAALCMRLEQQRLQLAILGQFKRGKSTFINALLGAPVLPSAVVPLTAVAVFIAWGAKPLARVEFKTQRAPEELRSTEPEILRDFLAQFVAEEQNPRNRLAVSRVELFYPAPILANGTVLIDTPGVGSTLQHNTEAAIAVLPECDAGLFIVSADPPITETELAYLQRLHGKIGHLFFVLNKIDYLDAGEQKTAAEFLRKVLSERSLLPSSAPVFVVSARNGLAAKQQNDRNGVDRSGIAAVEGHLLRYLATEKTRELNAAIRRNAGDVILEAISDIRLRMRTLKMPLEDLAAKATEFESALRAVEEQRRVTRDLLAGDRRRLLQLLETRIQELRSNTLARLATIIDESLLNDAQNSGEAKARNALSATIQDLFGNAQDRLVRAFADEASKSLAVHRQRFEALIGTVRQTAAEIFDVSFGPQQEGELFELGEEPYWVTETIKATLIPDPGRLIDRLVPLDVRRKRLRNRLIEQSSELVIRNAENLRWAILQGIEDLVRNTTSHLEERLDQAIDSIKLVIEDALKRRNDRSVEVGSELLELDRLASDLQTTHKTVVGEADGRGQT